MKKRLSFIATLLLTASSAQAQSVYQAGTDYAQGQAVNRYTNSGAAQFHRKVRSSGGVIRYTAPAATDIGLSATAPAPKAYTYGESAYRSGRRLVSAYVNEVDESGKKIALII